MSSSWDAASPDDWALSSLSSLPPRPPITTTAAATTSTTTTIGP
jgi:hypothetical protein